MKSFESSTLYSVKGKTYAPPHVDNLNDYYLKTGICVEKGWILFEFVFELFFNEIEISGFIGDPSNWTSSWGKGAKILTSRDKINWTYVGTIPNTFGTNILSLFLTCSTAKYIKFEFSYLTKKIPVQFTI